MSRSQTILSSLVATRQRVAEIESTDEVGAVLTLTRTSSLSITTAGTIITWQSEIRGYEITWSGSDITIPTSGWYILFVSIQSNSLNDLVYRMLVNGTSVQSSHSIGDVDRTNTSATFMRYFTEDDVVQIQLIPSANVTVSVIAEGSLNESPILNIVQLSGEVDTDDV